MKQGQNDSQPDSTLGFILKRLIFFFFFFFLKRCLSFLEEMLSSLDHFSNLKNQAKIYMAKIYMALLSEQWITHPLQFLGI